MKNKPTPARTRSRLSPDQRMADILAAARAVIAEKGYENAGVTEIARRAGLVEGSLYRFFTNKQDLLLRVAEDWFREQLDADPSVGSVEGTRNKLRYLVWRSLQVIRRNPPLARFIYTEIRPDPQYRGSVFHELNRRFTAEVREVIAAAVASGEFRKDVSPVLLRDMVFGCIEHRTWAFLRGEGDFSVEEVADGLANVIYRGMAAGPEALPQDGLPGLVARLEKVAGTLEKKGKPGH